MKILLLFACLVTFFRAECFAQCDAGSTAYYVSAYAIRNQGTIVTSTQAYATGPNAEYSTMFLTQNDTYQITNGSQFANGNQLNASASPGYTASNTRYTQVSTKGFGTYADQGFMSAYRSCDGRSFPPYDNGFSGYSNTASVVVTQPKASTNSSTMWIRSFPSYNPNGTVPGYNTSINLGSSANGASGTPSWTFTGATGGISVSCTNCAFPTVTAQPNATPQCNPNIQGYFTIDGLKSNTLYLAILAPVAGPNNSGTSTAVPGGYATNITWSVYDNCVLNTMPYLFLSEAFPSGFSYSTQGFNWGFPVANSWNASSSGTFVDTIGYSDSSGVSIPVPLSPQNPLGTQAVFSGLQTISAGSQSSGTYQITSQTQVHYQDHGAYK